MPVNPERSPMERRQHARIERNEQLFIQFADVPGAPELAGHTEACRSADVSAGGLCLRLSKLLPRDTRIDVWIAVGDREDKYFLSGHVAWCAYKPGREFYEIGVSLHAARGTDLERWAQLFA